MPDESNKTIAKNTMYLYMRMLLVTAVTLYTSRVVLLELGVDDYGIYSVLGGVITLFTFFSQSVNASSQRFITYELGRPDGNVSAIFGACLKIHLWMCLVILVIAETIGLWFVNYKMNFPPGSMQAVNWTYQLSVASCVATVLRTPFNALVLAHEKMSFYALNSIIDVTLKLIIVFLLVIIPGSKLVWYVFMIFFVTTAMTGWYVIYCRKNFNSVQIVTVINRSKYKDILTFSGWASFGGFANMGYQQGVNVIINLFYGVTINAAVGIATQINSAVTQFVHGFQQAVNPQLIKSEASGEQTRQMQLICLSAKFSFLIMLVVCYPLICNIDFVLKMWLGEFPPLTGIISSLIIIGALIETLSGPLWITIYAKGSIRNYQIVISSILLLNLPLSFLCGKLGMSAWWMYVVRIIIFMIALLIRLAYLKKLINLNVRYFFRTVFFPIIITCVVLILNEIIMLHWFGTAETLWQFFCQTIYLMLTAIVLSIVIVLTRSEKNKVKSIILEKLYNGRSMS